MSTVAVDFDGVIHKYSRGWHGGSIYDEPVEGAFDALHELMLAHAVVVFTCRTPLPVANWITDRSGIECVIEHRANFWSRTGVLLVTNKKYPAVAYIDDRGIRFENWVQAMGDMHRFTK